LTKYHNDTEKLDITNKTMWWCVLVVMTRSEKAVIGPPGLVLASTPVSFLIVRTTWRLIALSYNILQYKELLPSLSTNFPSLQKRFEAKQPHSVPKSQFCITEGAHLSWKFSSIHWPGMRYLSNYFQAGVIHNQSFRRTAELSGYCSFSENRLCSNGTIWDSSKRLDRWSSTRGPHKIFWNTQF
jgi:hypothetical protein